MDPLSRFLTLLAQALLVISLPILVGAVAYWLQQKASEIKGRLTQEQLAAVEKVVSVAVRAAEQAGLTKQLVGGAEKKNYALHMAQNYLNSKGIKLDVKTVASVIEAEVLRQFRSTAPPADTPEARAALIQSAVESAVLAAEQSGLTAAALNAGASLAQHKKQYAMELAGKFLAEHGLRVDMSLVDGLIEAQIMRFKMRAAEAAYR